MQKWIIRKHPKTGKLWVLGWEGKVYMAMVEVKDINEAKTKISQFENSERSMKAEILGWNLK